MNKFVITINFVINKNNKNSDLGLELENEIEKC